MLLHGSKVSWLDKGAGYYQARTSMGADITYVGKRDKLYYLSLMTDAHSKKIYDVSDSLSTQGCINALMNTSIY
jgi:hypothetical protein